MALLTDQPISCLADWMAYDTKLSILSAQESTSIESKSTLAQREIETQITGFLLRHSALGENGSRALLSKVTVTEALQRWHSMLTLHLFYADLAALQNSALHREQAGYYEQRADAAKQQLFETGVGIVNSPIPRASLPRLSSAAGTYPRRVLRARVRYVGYQDAVGSPSQEFIIDMSGGEEVTLLVENMPTTARGWLLYLGENSDKLFLASNEAMEEGVPLVITPELPASAIVLTYPAQKPDRYIRYSQDLWR